MLGIGTLSAVELELDRMRRFMVHIGHRVVALAHGTCYVTIGRQDVMAVRGAAGWWEVTVLIANGEHAGAVAVYTDSDQHRMLSAVIG